MSGSQTDVCVIIAAMNAEKTIARAIKSALAQPGVVEVAVIDDGSQDATTAVARACDDGTGRLKVTQLTRNVGPSAARNLAIASTTAPLLCVLDSDDYLLPDRLSRLIAWTDQPWDLIADDIVIVPERQATEALDIDRLRLESPVLWLNLESFISGNISHPSRPRGEYGFLKPLVRRSFLSDAKLHYDESLRLGEDYALYVQALAAGARFAVTPACGYIAVERANSLSSCHATGDLERLLAFDDWGLANLPNLSNTARRALHDHRNAAANKVTYARVLDARRATGYAAALLELTREPASIPHIASETVRAKSARLGAIFGMPRKDSDIRLLIGERSFVSPASHAPLNIEDPVLIAFGIDASYVPHVGVTIASIAMSTQRALHLTLLHVGVTDDDKVRVEACAPGARFEWIGINDPRVLSLEGIGHYASPATFFRLMLPKVMPSSASRVIYLDSDVVVVRDIGRLFDAPLGDSAIGAVTDAFVPSDEFETKWNLSPSQNGYFNAGVLLIDLVKARSDRLFERALAFAQNNLAELPFCDQDALNHAAWGQWCLLDPAWNAQQGMIMRGQNLPSGAQFVDHPAIIHYTGTDKPWLSSGYHPLSWTYLKVLDKTNFRDQVATQQGITRKVRLVSLGRYIKHKSFNALTDVSRHIQTALHSL